jgi:hypothetical protein
MAGSGTLKERWLALTVEQKLSVGVLGVACLAALTFGVVQVRASLLRPFTTDVQTLVDLKKALGPSEEELAETAKKTDTDGDGISDYDESNMYGTSPYVRDSDSDSIPDNLEIAQGTDPNCPKGQTCFASSNTAAATGTSPIALPSQGGFGGVLGGSGSTPQPPTSRDPKQIRAYLESIGVSKQELASYTDAQILEAYDQTVLEFQQQSATSTR